jgi:four helix bundle protein
MNESPVYTRTYDLLLWLLPQATKFPRQHRFGLGERLVRRALDFQETLIAAGQASGAERRSLLLQADTLLAQARQMLRLCKDLGLLSLGQYEHVSKMVVEIGRLLGGWIKKTVV